MRKRALMAMMAAAWLLGAPASAGPKAKAAAAPAALAAGPSVLVLEPALPLPADYAGLLGRAARRKASLVVLPLRRAADGQEGAFEFAQVALDSGLFAKVSVGDDLGRADYAVTGTWRSWTRHAGGSKADPVWGSARWMYAGCDVSLELYRDGESLDSLKPGEVEAELYLEAPIMASQLAEAGHVALHQAYQAALYRIAKDILKRSHP